MIFVQYMNEVWIYKKGKLVKRTKWDLFWKKIKYYTRLKIVNINKYYLIPSNNMKRYFSLSKKQYEQAKEIYKNKGTISYEFIPTGIDYIVVVKVLDTNEKIDITDYDTWQSQQLEL